MNSGIRKITGKETTLKRIESLTKEQEDRFQEFIDKWTKIGLSTEKANREEAEKGILMAYKTAGLKAPKIVWCDSPLSMGLTRAIVVGLAKGQVNVGKNVKDSVWASVMDSVWDSVRDSVRDSVMASVRDSVGASVWDSVRDSVRDSVWASVRDSVMDSVWDSVRASVRDSVWDSVWDSVGASVRDSVRDSVMASVNQSGYGQHDANWLGFYDFFKDACALEEETQKLIGMWQISKNAGWWFPHEKICWISERHNILNRDGMGRLHSSTKPSVQYPDGWAIYAWHGVRVPEKVILFPESITLQEIEKELNLEIQRIMIERYGADKYLEEVKAEELDCDNLGLEGSHERILFRDNKDRNWLLCSDGSTGRVYTLAVDDRAKTCKQAHESICGFDESRIKSEA